MNDREKQLYEKLNLEKLKTEMELVATRRDHFLVAKLDSIDNDFNELLEEKELSEEFKNNILSKWHKNVENVNKRLEEDWKNNIQEKRNALKKIKKNYKRDLIQHLNHQAQHKQGKIKIRETQAAFIQTTMKDINLITSSQKTSSATIINLTNKHFIAKNDQLIVVHIIKIAIIVTK